MFLKKRISIVLLSFILLTSKIFSQGVMLVEDSMSIATAIENGLKMYQQLQQAIQTYQKTVEQLKEIKRQAENLDLTKYDWTKIDGILTLVDDYMTYYDDIEYLVNNKNMQIGDLRFSLKDVYDTDLYTKWIPDELNDKVNPANIDEYEQAAFASRHGMTYTHYLKIAGLEQELAKKAQETKVVVEKQQEALPKMGEGIFELTKNTDGELNGVQVAQLTEHLTNQIFNNTLFLADVVSRQADIQSSYYQYQMMQDALNQENVERSSNQIDKFESKRDEKSVCGKPENYLKADESVQIKMGEIRF